MRISAVLLVFLLSALPVSAQVQRPPTNADFAALTATVNALTARIAKLESGAITSADVVGTYRLFSLGIEMHGNPTDIGNEVADATITFRADGTATVNWTDYRADLHQGSPWFITHGVDPVEGEAPWSLTSDGRLIVGSDPNDSLEATVGAGGRIIFWGGQSQTVNGSWSQLAIAVKLP
jgi:hypothetical protein